MGDASPVNREPGTDRQPLPRGFWVIWTTVALDLVGFGIIVPILALYAKRFGASPLQIGLLGATFSVAQFGCAPLLGRLSDRIGRKPVIVISLVGTAVGSFVTGAAGVLWLVFLGRALDGASGASVSVAQGAVTDVVAPQDRARALGLLGAAFGVGFVVGPAIGGLAALGGPHVPFFVAGAIALVNAVVALRRLPETRPRPDRSVPARTSDLAARPVLALLAAVGFLSTMGFVGFEITFSLLGDRRFGLTEASASAVFLGLGVMLVAVQGGLVGRLSERFGSERVLIGALGGIAAGLAVTAGATAWPAFVVALTLLAVGQGLAVPSITTLVAGAAGEARRGQALGLQQSSNALARIAGQPLAGLLFGVAVPLPYLVGAGVAGLAGVLAVALVRRTAMRD